MGENQQWSPKGPRRILSGDGRWGVCGVGVLCVGLEAVFPFDRLSFVDSEPDQLDTPTPPHRKQVTVRQKKKKWAARLLFHVSSFIERCFKMGCCICDSFSLLYVVGLRGVDAGSGGCHCDSRRDWRRCASCTTITVVTHSMQSIYRSVCE